MIHLLILRQPFLFRRLVSILLLTCVASASWLLGHGQAQDSVAVGSPETLAAEPTAAVTLAEATAEGQVRSPEAYLGRPVGTDFELADWSQVSGYYRELAESSPRVLLENRGPTSEGRDFLVAVISDEGNLSRLDEIKRYSKQIADPRGLTDDQREAVIRDGKVIVFVTPTMHATEVAATEMAMQFSWLLATSDEEPWRSARKDAVVVITPSLNPDGVDHVADWYREHLGTPLEGAALTRLYQLYTGHDNNRDWFMLTQAETKILTHLLYHEWLPQLLWDVHQQGSTAERFFVPPYRDPLNPNLDPGIVAGINLIGTRAVMDMTRGGLTGIASGISYDNWWNGGNRSVPGRHHIIGILTEAASAKFASPIFQTQASLKDPLATSRYQPSNQFLRPWAGGWWRVSDIIQYELAFGQSLLGSIVREPEFWRRNKMEAAQRSIDAGLVGGPRGWLIPPDAEDVGAARRLIEVLLATGVEIRVSNEPFEADGRQHPAGTVVILGDQPYGNYVKDLFELQDFPPGTKPYDVTGWTLPLLLGVRRVEVSHDFQADLTIVDNAETAIASFAGDPRLLDLSVDGVLSTSNSDSWKTIVKRLQQGESLKMLTDPASAGLVTVAIDNDGHKVFGNVDMHRMPRIGVYAPWAASMDEGWLRWVLDHYEIPFLTIRNEHLQAGNLDEILDVLIIPSMSAATINRGRAADSIPLPLAGGTDPEGSLTIEAFVREGGTLITMDSSCAWAIDLFQLPVVDVTKGAKDFSCPGSILRAVVQSDPLTAGLPHNIPVFFSDSAGWREMTKAERDAGGVEAREMTTLLRYAPTRLLMSGALEGSKTLENQGAWAVLPHGEGQIHLFGFRPHYRAWSQATFHLLFRAMLLGTTAGEAND